LVWGQVPPTHLVLNHPDFDFLDILEIDLLYLERYIILFTDLISIVAINKNQLIIFFLPRNNLYLPFPETASS
jgi:hypothetical protein